MTEEIKINTDWFPISTEALKALSSAGEMLVNIGNSQLVQSAQTMIEIAEALGTQTAAMLEEITPVITAVSESMQTVIINETFQNMISVMGQLQSTADRINYVNKPAGSFEISEELAEKYSKRFVQENLYDATVEETKKSIKVTGQPVPYNVFSNKFIFSVYIPTKAAFTTLSSVDEYSPEFITQFIMFTLLPIIYFLSTMKEEKRVEIVYCEDEE